MTAATRVRRGGITPAIYAAVIDEGECRYCRSTFVDSLEVDHIIPWSRGGSDDPENLAPACFRCNIEKSAQTPDEWAAYRMSKGMPWPIPSPDETARALVENMPPEALDARWTEDAGRAAHAAMIRGRGAGFDPAAEAEALAAILLLGGVVG